LRSIAGCSIGSINEIADLLPTSGRPRQALSHLAVSRDRETRGAVLLWALWAKSALATWKPSAASRASRTHPNASGLAPFRRIRVAGVADDEAIARK
jgi:hypothetical protein